MMIMFVYFYLLHLFYYIMFIRLYQENNRDMNEIRKEMKEIGMVCRWLAERRAKETQVLSLQEPTSGSWCGMTNSRRWLRCVLGLFVFL